MHECVYAMINEIDPLPPAIVKICPDDDLGLLLSAPDIYDAQIDLDPHDDEDEEDDDEFVHVSSCLHDLLKQVRILHL